MSDGVVRLEIPGDPVPWARAGKKGKRHYTQAPQARHMEAVQRAWMFAGRPKIAGAVVVSASFWLPRRRDHYGIGKHADRVRPGAPALASVKPDLSNLLKIVEDALNGLLWADDARIVCVAGLHKHYADAPGEPRGKSRTVLTAWPSRQ